MTDTAEMTTDEMLVAMLTENTGRHFLDSGGAYGRHWEQNRGLTVEACQARPAIAAAIGTRYVRNGERWESTDESIVEFVTLDTFHFLSERLDYAPEQDAAFHAYANLPENESESWLVLVRQWLDSIGAKWNDGPYVVENTYNHEDALSQTLQYALYSDPDTDETVVLLQIHGGCDVRGGYTAPRAFFVSDYALFDNASFYVILTDPEDDDNRVMIDYVGNVEQYREGPDVDFRFCDTPVIVADDGTITLADGPGKGWRVDFYPPYASE